MAVLTGAGGTFCAGADLKALSEGDRRPVTEDGPGPMGPTRLDLSKPVIAAIEGHAVAGGLELALWCDLRVAATDAVLGVYCRRFGVPLVDGGTVRLPRLIGQSHALDLVLTGRGVGGPEALGMGLVNRLAPPGRPSRRPSRSPSTSPAFPQTCLRNDRRSVLWQWGLTEPDALVLEARFGLHTIDSGETAGRGPIRVGGGSPRHARRRRPRGAGPVSVARDDDAVAGRRADAGPRRGRRLRLRRDPHPGRERVEVPDRPVRARRRALGRDRTPAQAGAGRPLRGPRPPTRPRRPSSCAPWRGARADDVAERAAAFGVAHYRRRHRTEVRARLDWHRRQGHRVVMVSASPEFYVRRGGRRARGRRRGGHPARGRTGTGSSPGASTGGNCRGPEKLAAAPATGWRPRLGHGDAPTAHVSTDTPICGPTATAPATSRCSRPPTSGSTPGGWAASAQLRRFRRLGDVLTAW